jgi:Aspartyl protease
MRFVAGASVVFVVVLLRALSAAEPLSSAEISRRYEAQDWFGLHTVPDASLPVEVRAASAAAFLRPEAVGALEEIITAAPKSNQAREAHRWLTHLFFGTGQYQKLAVNLENHIRSFPEDADALNDRKDMGPLLELPDQGVISGTGGVARHGGDLFVPVRINDVDGNYFIDTGAGISSISESEAKRVGLRFMRSSGAMGTSTTQRSGYRAAVADDLVIGGVHLRSVGFAVFPDTGEPWVNLPPGRRGLIGLPVQIAVRRIRWSRDGTFAFGVAATKARSAEPNIAMIDDHPAVRVAIGDRTVLFTLDSGAVNTDLYEKFGKEFPQLMAAGRQSSAEVRGIGGAESFSSTKLADVHIAIGDAKVTLRSPDVLGRQVGSPRFVGNLGFDLLKQTGAFLVDFEAMRLELLEVP